MLLGGLDRGCLWQKNKHNIQFESLCPQIQGRPISLGLSNQRRIILLGLKVSGTRATEQVLERKPNAAHIYMH